MSRFLLFHNPSYAVNIFVAKCLIDFLLLAVNDICIIDTEVFQANCYSLWRNNKEGQRAAKRLQNNTEFERIRCSV